MKTKVKKCFVCQREVIVDQFTINPELNLPVCEKCKGTKEEKVAIDEYLDSLAEGFVCGCI